jgi:hypothetical protein
VLILVLNKAVGQVYTAQAAIKLVVNIAMSIDDIAQRIHLIRGQRVNLDTDLAAFYGEATKPKAKAMSTVKKTAAVKAERKK